MKIHKWGIFKLSWKGRYWKAVVYGELLKEKDIYSEKKV